MSMTWKEFKDTLEKNGVKDNDEIWFIDISLPDNRDSCRELNVHKDPQLGLAVSN